MNKQSRYGKPRMGVVLVIGLALAACGYRFSGGGELPGGVKSLNIAVFENHTRETSLEQIITNDLINRFTRFKTVRLTGKKNAEACLSGVIKSASISTIAHKSAHASTQRRIRVQVDLRLTSPDGGLLWAADNVAEDEAYDIASDKLRTEQNKKSALTTLSKRLAERIYYRLTDNF